MSSGGGARRVRCTGCGRRCPVTEASCPRCGTALPRPADPPARPDGAADIGAELTPASFGAVPARPAGQGSSAVAAHGGSAGTPRRRRTGRIALVALLVLALVGAGAGAAWAARPVWRGQVLTTQNALAAWSADARTRWRLTARQAGGPECDQHCALTMLGSSAGELLLLVTGQPAGTQTARHRFVTVNVDSGAPLRRSGWVGESEWQPSGCEPAPTTWVCRESLVQWDQQGRPDGAPPEDDARVAWLDRADLRPRGSSAAFSIMAGAPVLVGDDAIVAMPDPVPDGQSMLVTRRWAPGGRARWTSRQAATPPESLSFDAVDGDSGWVRGDDFVVPGYTTAQGGPVVLDLRTGRSVARTGTVDRDVTGTPVRVDVESGTVAIAGHPVGERSRVLVPSSVTGSGPAVAAMGDGSSDSITVYDAAGKQLWQRGRTRLAALCGGRALLTPVPEPMQSGPEGTTDFAPPQDPTVRADLVDVTTGIRSASIEVDASSTALWCAGPDLLRWKSPRLQTIDAVTGAVRHTLTLTGAEQPWLLSNGDGVVFFATDASTVQLVR